MTLHFVRHGEGPRLLLVHGLGGTLHSWSTILPALSKAREVTAIDLPGHGQTPAAADSGTFDGLADSVERFILEQELDGVDIVGSSLGARIVLEVARRGRVGATVALDPGGFWRGWERTYFRTTLAASIRLLRGLRPALPSLSRSAVMRSALLAQLSARPWRLDGEVVAAAEFCQHENLRCSRARSCDRARAKRSRGRSRPSSRHRLGPPGRSLSAATSRSRSRGVPIRQATLVLEVRSLPHVGPHRRDGTAHPRDDRQRPAAGFVNTEIICFTKPECAFGQSPRRRSAKSRHRGEARDQTSVNGLLCGLISGAMAKPT